MKLRAISARPSSATWSWPDARAAWRRVRNVAPPVATLTALIVIWEAACRIFPIPPYVLPPPSAVFSSGANVPAMLWLGHVAATLEVVIIGFAASILVAVPLAMLLSASKLLSRSIFPVLVIVQSTPIVAIAPIIVVTLGTGILARIVIAFAIGFMPLVISTATGLQATPLELIELSRSLRARRIREYLQIRLPFAVPYIFSGLKVTMTLCVIGAVVSEFVAADKGLGYFILMSTSYFKVAQAFSALAVLVATSLLLFQLICALQRGLFPWSLPKYPPA